MVGSLDSFLVVCHAIRMLCVRSVEVMTSSHLVYQCISGINGRFAKRVDEYCFLYASYRLFDSSVRPCM